MVTRFAALYERLSSNDEDDLIRVAQKGNHEAFNQLVLSYQDRIFSLAVRMLGDEDAAEDITQNTFLTAYINLPRFRNGSFRSWLFRIAANLCYDVHRKHKRHPVSSIENQDLAEENLLPLNDFSGSSDFPEAEVEKLELEQTIQGALNQLDEDQRTVVVLVDLQEFDYLEAAHIIGVPIGTVKSRLARARGRLQQLLGSLVGIQ